MNTGFITEEFAAATQIERELETEDLVLLSQLRKAQRPEKEQILPARSTLPYIAKASLPKPGVQVAQGR
jgi:hypothetical protein